MVRSGRGWISPSSHAILRLRFKLEWALGRAARGSMKQGVRVHRNLKRIQSVPDATLRFCGPAEALPGDLVCLWAMPCMADDRC